MEIDTTRMVTKRHTAGLQLSVESSWFCIKLLDWLKKLAPLFHPIRNKAKTNRDSAGTRFPALCVSSMQLL